MANDKNRTPKLLNPKKRKAIHYSLIICILLIQIAIAAFFYNEFVNRKNLDFIQNQLGEIKNFEKLTDSSKQDLLQSQDYFQKYIATGDKDFLNLYFDASKKLSKDLDSLNSYKFKNARLNTILESKKNDTLNLKKFKVLIDSTTQISRTEKTVKEPKYEIKKYKTDYNFEKIDVETKTFSDTIKKKGLFGRLKDAIAGKENVRKDSTVVTVKHNEKPESERLKYEIDSLLGTMDKFYTKEIQRVQVNITKTQENKNQFASQFQSLLNEIFISSNQLMNIYDNTIKDAKAELEKEYEKQNSKSNKTRMYLTFGSMLLMFIVSILIMYFTRLAFAYEHRLKIANQQIEENLNFKNRILGMLSHELRSPLKIIGIFINRITKKTNDDNIKEYLKSISFTNNSLLLQSNQILEYAKNQHVKNKLIPVSFNLKNEISSIYTSIEAYIETRHNQFVTEINIPDQLEVYSDNAKMNQIFMNILGNANKFTENGKITAKTWTEALDKDTITLHASISDTGSGISESDLEKIFEPYYQGVISNEVENLGAGLGLSLCKEIVELFSGKISATSQLGKGTTISFSINLNLANGTSGQ
ncbi:HAMP domain-containing sensor histidine kinase [Soonwooa sp.]|uniref:sensor histidine kinase n=1 Tax=Soonwooa sp. TaxID=1938592 RepID=UPI00260543A1|nr:HAMP domain-containing sensor histidine kinase [Soonwooa sp.]